MSGEEKRKIRILLADGHYIVRQGIRRIFEAESDFEVVGEADDGEQVVKSAKELSPDIIVMEARIGKLDSVAATKRVREQHPDGAVLVLTAYDDEDYIVELLRAGAAGCLLKSADGEQLVQAIRAICRGVLVVDPLVEQGILKRICTTQKVAVSATEYLTRRELQVLRLASKGMNTRDMASELGIGTRTCKHHLLNLYGKMGVRSRTDAVLKAVQRGWVTLEHDQGQR